jgi:hypothetical protein
MTSGGAVRSPTCNPPKLEIIMLNLKTLVSGLVLATSVAALPAFAGDDWYRSTGGVAPQLQGDDYFARSTGGVPPQAQGDDFYFRATGGVAPQAQGDDFYFRATGGVAPQVSAE